MFKRLRVHNGYLYGLTEAEMALIQCWRLIQVGASYCCSRRYAAEINLCSTTLAIRTALMAAACFPEEQTKVQA